MIRVSRARQIRRKVMQQKQNALHINKADLIKLEKQVYLLSHWVGQLKWSTPRK